VSLTEKVRISAVEEIEIERVGETVQLTLLIAGRHVLSKHLRPDAARRIGDALGYLSNDIALDALPWPRSA